MTFSRELHLSLWHTVSGDRWLGPDPLSVSSYSGWERVIEQHFPQHSYLLTFPSTHLCWPVNITHLTAFTHCVLSRLTAERWEMRLQGWVIHPSLGFVVHTRRYKQYGRQGLEAASRQSILLRKSGSTSLHVIWADQLSATVSSISCHTLFSSIACFLLNFYTANGDCAMRVVCHVLSPPSSISVVTSLHLSRSPSVAAVLYNPTDLQCPYEIKLATPGVRNTGGTLNIWAHFLASGQNSFHLTHWSLADVLVDLEQKKILMKCVNCNIQTQYLTL